MTKTNIKIGQSGAEDEIVLCPGQNLFTGEKPFTNEFGGPNSLESDLLNLAAGIFASDLIVARPEREQFIRTIDLTVEVVNVHAFKRIADLLMEALLTVSRDNWNVKFIQKQGKATSDFKWENKKGAVLLFSGGLDSMCAASKLMEDKEKLVLVSHNSHANTAVDTSQRNVHNALETFYRKSIKNIHIKVYGRNKGEYKFPVERENTQRTRSFMFLSLAALVTRRSGFNKILFMAENGQFAIHLPLNQARVSAFSTHTADPYFIKVVEKLFKTLFENENFEIFNPFLYMTKAEVVALLPDGLKQQASHSASCWMISRIPDNKHCGLCIPCISRRIAIEHNGISFNEYENDIFSVDLNTLEDDNTGKRNLIDYLEFVTKFHNVSDVNRNDLLMEFPELLNEAIDQEQALNLYQRIASQSFNVFKNYPKVLEII